MNKYRFWGSTATIVFGVLSIIAGIAGRIQAPETQAGLVNFEAGVGMLLGAVAYRSAKKRRLGLKPDARKSLVLETICIGLVSQWILLGVFVFRIGYERPLTAFFIPIWAIIAYFLVLRKPAHNPGDVG